MRPEFCNRVGLFFTQMGFERGEKNLYPIVSPIHVIYTFWQPVFHILDYFAIKIGALESTKRVPIFAADPTR